MSRAGALILVALVAIPAAARAGSIVMLSDLPPAARAALVARIRVLGLADSVDVRIVAPGELAPALVASSGPTLSFGFPLAAYAPVLDRCVAGAKLPDTAPPELSASEHRAVALWFDALRVAEPAVNDDVDGARALDRPISLVELTRGGFEDRVFLAEPQPWNIGGQLIATLSFTAESTGLGDRLVVGLDANVVLPYLPDDSIVLARLLAAPPSSIAAVARSALVKEAREQGAAGAFRIARPAGGPVVVLRGVAAHGVDAEAAGAWLSAFDHETVRAIATAADLVPLSVPVGDTIDDAEDEADRVLVGANAESVVRAQLEAAPLLRRFAAELRGSLERRAERFSEVFDTIGMLAIVAVVAILLIKRRRDVRARDGAPPAPE